METIKKSSFELKSVVPWGRTLEEYQRFFQLKSDDLKKRILSVGDGPASFNAEMNGRGNQVTSLDPIYQFSKVALQQRILETRDEIMLQMRNNADKFIWNNIESPEALEQIRMNAMEKFIEDFEAGKVLGRYRYHEMPDAIDVADHSYDIGLSSHFLILYAKLGLDFHIRSIAELLRVCKEVRIFPLLNLNAERSEVVDGIIMHFGNTHTVKIIKVEYEFQKNGNEMMVLTSTQI